MKYTMRTDVSLHPEDTVLQFMTDLVETGGVLDPASDMEVSEPSGGGLNVDVGIGRGYLKKSSTNAYPARITSGETVSVDTNSSGSPRIDSVVLFVDLDATPGVNSQGEDVLDFRVVPGTPAGSPTAPNSSQIEAEIGSGNPYIVLADIAVADGATGISAGNITDRRTKVVMSSLVSQSDGWIEYTTVTPTRSVSDDPSYEITFAGVDLTDVLQAGMKVKWTQNSTERFGIITKVALDGSDTDVTIFGGTDYDVDDTTTYAISDFNYSLQKTPFGFPMSPTLWRIHADVGRYTKSSPAANVWYGNNLEIDVPIGAWELSYNSGVQGFKASAQLRAAITLSDDGSTETDDDMTAWVRSDYGGVVSVPAHRKTHYLLTAKTTFELMVMSPTTSMTQINILGDNGTSTITAVCAYL